MNDSKKYVCQFSVDVALTEEEYNRGNMEKKIEDTLVSAGIDVVSDYRYSWNATWTTEGYEAGDGPISYE